MPSIETLNRLLTIDKPDFKMPSGNVPKPWKERIRGLIESRYLFLVTLKFAVNLGTLPYYRTFEFNTLRPILLIADCTSPLQYNKLLFHLCRWRTRKLAELQYISIASAILAAAAIGSFSWNAVADAYWLASAFWYSSLVLSILGILLSAQQVTVLQLMGKPPTPANVNPSIIADIRHYLPLLLTEVRRQGSHTEFLESRDGIGVWKPRWKMIFTWQCPIMFLSYSVLFFLAGLTLFVCTPLIRRNGWNTDSYIAVAYLVTAVVAGGTFMFCSFWVYHYVDLEHESQDATESEASFLRPLGM